MANARGQKRNKADDNNKNARRNRWEGPGVFAKKKKKKKHKKLSNAMDQRGIIQDPSTVIKPSPFSMPGWFASLMGGAMEQDQSRETFSVAWPAFYAGQICKLN